MFDVFEPARGLHVTEIGWLPDRVYARTRRPQTVVYVQGRGHGVLPDPVIDLEFPFFDLRLINLLLCPQDVFIQPREECPVAVGRRRRLVGRSYHGRQA